MDINLSHVRWRLAWILCLLHVAYVVKGDFQCPENYLLFNEECLYMVNNAMPWHQAHGLCESRNTSLLTIMDQEKNDFIGDSRLCNMQECWMDLKRGHRGGPFVWQRAGTQANYAHWFRTQPDAGQNGCASLKYGSWYNRYCKYELEYICEKPEWSGCDADQWQVFSGSCYKKVTEPESWMNAREGCMNDMADLVVIETEDEDIYLTDIFGNSPEGIWIGLHQDLAFRWVWLDQPYSELSSMVWVNWASSQPDVPDNDFRDCVFMRISQRNPWSDDRATEETWYTENCQTSLAVICEAPLASGEHRCKNGWMYYDDSCYLMDDKPLSWWHARAFCQSHDADLVVIETQEENVFLIEAIGDSSWIGLNNIEESNVWAWLDGQVPMEYTDFYRDFEEINLSQPHVYNCVMVYSSQESLGRWANQMCQRMFGYICESPTPADSWIEHGGKFYHFSMEPWTVTSWEVAREVCRQQHEDADLVVIDSHGLQRFINAHISGRVDVPGFWTGINSVRHRHRFFGLDSDEELMYTNWGIGEPVYIEDEFCVSVAVPLYENSHLNQVNNDYEVDSTAPRHAYWNDVPCKDMNYPVCQTPAVGAPSFYDFRHGNSLYKYISGNFTAEDGLQYCASHFGTNASLANIRNWDVEEGVAEQLLMRYRGRKHIIEFWIGAFMSRETDPAEQCVRGSLQLMPATAMGNDLMQCQWRGDILCEKGIEPSEQISDFSSGRSDYTMMAGKTSDTDAEYTCGFVIPGGGKLLEIHSDEELELISRELIVRHRGSSFEYWIYGNVDDTFIYHNIDRMPEEGEECLMLSLPSFPDVDDSVQLLITPASCYGAKYFVCEREYLL